MNHSLIAVHSSYLVRVGGGFGRLVLTNSNKARKAQRDACKMCVSEHRKVVGVFVVVPYIHQCMEGMNASCPCLMPSVLPYAVQCVLRCVSEHRQEVVVLIVVPIYSPLHLENQCMQCVAVCCSVLQPIAFGVSFLHSQNSERQSLISVFRSLLPRSVEKR